MTLQFRAALKFIRSRDLALFNILRYPLSIGRHISYFQPLILISCTQHIWTLLHAFGRQNVEMFIETFKNLRFYIRGTKVT